MVSRMDIIKLDGGSMKKVSLYQTVRLVTNRLLDRGFKLGMTGVVLEQYDEEHFEIEFFDDLGNWVGCRSFHVDDFELIDD